jgi:hypothetical protein
MEIETPQGLGGQQGFRVGAEVGGHDEEGKTNYREMWSESIIRVDVRNSVRYRSLVRIAGNEENYSVVRKLIHDWGFDIQVVDEDREAGGEFAQDENRPLCFFGVLLPGNDDALSRQRLSNTASIADSHNVFVVIFKHESTDLPTLPSSKMIIEFGPSDELPLEEEAGPQLLDIRQAEELGLREQFFELVEREGRESPRILLWALVSYVICRRLEHTRQLMIRWRRLKA